MSDGLSLTGRVLVLSQNAELLRAQLAGADVSLQAAGALRDRISTDEITPAWACYYFDATRARGRWLSGAGGR